MLNEEIRDVISQSVFMPIVTVTPEQKPHLIVVGKAKSVPDERTIVFGVYKMETTGKNLQNNSYMQCAAVFEKKGYRFSGRGRIDGDKLTFTVESVDALL